jgi:hypothetical protein
MTKEFKPIRFDNIEQLCNTSILIKGALLKYRWTGSAILSYGLDDHDNEWYFGIVSEVLWYIIKPTAQVSDSKGMLCHEIGVRETGGNAYRTIDLKCYEIMILA